MLFWLTSYSNECVEWILFILYVINLGYYNEWVLGVGPNEFICAKSWWFEWVSTWRGPRRVSIIPLFGGAAVGLSNNVLSLSSLDRVPKPSNVAPNGAVLPIVPLAWPNKSPIPPPDTTELYISSSPPCNLSLASLAADYTILGSLDALNVVINVWVSYWWHISSNSSGVIWASWANVTEPYGFTFAEWSPISFGLNKNGLILLNASLHYSERLQLPLRPRLVLFEGHSLDRPLRN